MESVTNAPLKISLSEDGIIPEFASRVMKANSYYSLPLFDFSVFYKLKDGYYCFGETAPRLAKLLGREFFKQYGLNVLRIPDDLFQGELDALSSFRIPVRVIFYINSNGELDIPDIDEMEMEKILDY